jgi:hypothetical protein
MSDKKTHWKKTDNPNYLGSYAFDEDEEKKLKISKVTVEKVFNPNDNSEEECLVAHFTDKGTKPLILNTTNKKAIEKAVGSPYIEDWAGQAIQLFTTKIKAFGELVDAVRVRTKQPTLKKPKLTPSHKKWSSIVANMRKGDLNMDGVKKYFTVSKDIEKRLNKAVEEDAE